MTSTEAGVRELCANTRESGTPAFALRCHWYASVFEIPSSDNTHHSKYGAVCYKNH